MCQVSPQERQKETGGRGRREKRVLVTKKLDESPEGKPLKFAVIDNPVWLQEHEWWVGYRRLLGCDCGCLDDC